MRDARLKPKVVETVTLCNIEPHLHDPFESILVEAPRRLESTDEDAEPILLRLERSRV